MPFVPADLDAIDAAIKKGVRKVEYKDGAVTYGSFDELNKARNLISAQVNREDRNRNSQIRITTKSGL